MAPAAAAAAPAVKSDDEDDYEEYIPVSKRRAMVADRLRHQRLSKPAAPSSAGSPASLPPPPPQPTTNPVAAPDAVAPSAKPSLLVTSTQLKRAAPEVTATEQLILQEKEMIENLADG
ncbi:hypothetical protein QYE76_000842 [Lolium multiflorum]|uniref:Uncharacterized protein n=1 Tax=Lolium multiflorum TaxID=4521 RepID=A0AAD8RKT9_LOLMU|nr:hypothetical protein QYE76_000797 [Lolium multiflorum]KAK1626527.1 hypothetical protein QYE76_000842 [Lolium multiflorum]